MCVGNIHLLPEKTRRILQQAKKNTATNTGLVLNLALSYGSRDEITRAVREIAQKVKAGEVTVGDIDESLISSHLQTAGLPDPDLIIRTSGEFRISNFLLWQIAYSEIFVTKTLWPDFSKEDLAHAIGNYLKRERRFGMVTEQIAS
jgi:undecaprenyl diphosphate synthase